MMAGTDIRRAVTSDIDALVELRIAFEGIQRNSAAIDWSARRAELVAMLGRELSEERLVAWLCFREGRAVASGILSLPSDGRGEGLEGRRRVAPSRRPRIVPGEGLLHSLYTEPNYRRQGICGSILGIIVKEARDRGLKRLRLQSSEDGRSLYLRRGFNPESGSSNSMLLSLD